MKGKDVLIDKRKVKGLAVSSYSRSMNNDQLCCHSGPNSWQPSLPSDETVYNLKGILPINNVTIQTTPFLAHIFPILHT